MNVGTYLLLTVPLVGGSLYAYDSLRKDPAPAEPAAYAPAVPRTEVRIAEGPTLQGDPTAATERIVRQMLERYMAELKGSAAGTASVVPGSPAAAPSSGPAPAIDFGSEPVASSDGTPTSFDEHTLKVFRSYLDEAQRREREENLRNSITQNLDRLGVSLSDSQRKAAVDLTVKYWRERREALQAIPAGQQSREARVKATQQAQEAFSKALSDVLPASEAQKIVEGLGQWGGGRGAFDGGGGGMRPGRPPGAGNAGGDGN